MVAEGSITNNFCRHAEGGERTGRVCTVEMVAAANESTLDPELVAMPTKPSMSFFC